MRIVVFLNESNESNHQLERLARQHEIAALVVSSRAINGDRPGRLLRRLWHDGGWSFVLRKALNILGFRFLSRVWPGRRGLSRSAAAVAGQYGFPVLRVNDVNSRESLTRLAELEADLFVSIYFNQIFRAPVLELPKIGTLNVHGSMLPHFRGLFPYFWSLASNHARAGISVHWIDSGIDTGRVVAQGVLDLGSEETVFGLARRQAAVGAELLVRVIVRLEGGSLLGWPQGDGGSYRSWPTRRAVRRLESHGRGFGRILAPIEKAGSYESIEAQPEPVRLARARS